MIYLFLAEGFEEVEALTPLDMLRRVGVAVTTVGVGGRVVNGAHGIGVVADITTDQVDFDAMEGIVLPGGMPGTLNLEADPTVQQAIDRCVQQGNLIAAICAAPSILGHKGLLQSKQATCFPGFEKDCAGAQMQAVGAVAHDNIITARGAGCAALFGKAIVSYIKGDDVAEKLVQDMQGNYEGYKRV